jgi:predicted alpha/beta-fold hydrolase
MASHCLGQAAAALLVFTLGVGTARPTRAGGLIPAESAVASSYKDAGLVTAHELTVDGVRVHYLAAGPDASTAARVVLFCHGAAFTSHTWQITGVLDELGAQGFAAVALDLPGYGQSEALRSARLATADHREPDRCVISLVTQEEGAPRQGLLPTF